MTNAYMMLTLWELLLLLLAFGVWAAAALRLLRWDEAAARQRARIVLLFATGTAVFLVAAVLMLRRVLLEDESALRFLNC